MDRILGMFFGVVLSIVAPGVVEAYTIPSFPSCTNPQGSLIASYATGTHGIVGDTAVYQGEDRVYSLTDQSLLQCFCADNGSGIETRWWKSGSLSSEEKRYLESDGWIHVPDGSLWGLQKADYMAKNLRYACKTSSGDGGGEILGTNIGGVAGQVLGLASTGGRWQPYVLLLVAVISFGIAFSGKKD